MPGDAVSTDELVRVADQRLYQGKHAGRDRVVGAAGEETGPPGALRAHGKR